MSEWVWCLGFSGTLIYVCYLLSRPDEQFHIVPNWLSDWLWKWAHKPEKAEGAIRKGE